MFGKTIADMRELVNDVRTDADQHVRRIAESVDDASALIVSALLVTVVLAGLALVVAVRNSHG